MEEKIPFHSAEGEGEVVIRFPTPQPPAQPPAQTTAQPQSQPLAQPFPLALVAGSLGLALGMGLATMAVWQNPDQANLRNLESQLNQQNQELIRLKQCLE